MHCFVRFPVMSVSVISESFEKACALPILTMIHRARHIISTQYELLSEFIHQKMNK